MINATWKYKYKSIQRNLNSTLTCKHFQQLFWFISLRLLYYIFSYYTFINVYQFKMYRKLVSLIELNSVSQFLINLLILSLSHNVNCFYKVLQYFKQLYDIFGFFEGD